MRTITVDEARAELSKVLDEVEAGAEVVIARDHKPVARLVPMAGSGARQRPKVGTLRGAPFSIPDAAFAALTPDELKEWGL
jgi:prevent-host-death family protein